MVLYFGAWAQHPNQPKGRVMKNNMRLKICTPVYDTVPQQLIEAIGKLKEAGIEYEWYRAGGPLIFKNRNELVDKHGLSDFTHVVMWDADITATPAQVKQLIAHGQPVVGAAYKFRVKYLEHYVAGRGDKGYVHSSKTGLIQVPFVGMGLCAIEVGVFEQIKKPYFCHLMQGDTQSAEDVGFCIKANEAGIPVLLDCDCEVQHGIQPQKKQIPNVDGLLLDANEALTKVAATMAVLKRMITNG